MELVSFLLPLIGALWWPFCRILAMLSASPVIGDGAVPVTVTVSSYAVRRGARLIGTNDDATYPTPTGPIPGGGAILASVEGGIVGMAILAGRRLGRPVTLRLALTRIGEPASARIARRKGGGLVADWLTRRGGSSTVL